MIRGNKSINKLMVKTVFEGNILIPLPKLLVENRFHSLFSIISPTHCDYKYEVKKLFSLALPVFTQNSLLSLLKKNIY